MHDQEVKAEKLLNGNTLLILLPGCVCFIPVAASSPMNLQWHKLNSLSGYALILTMDGIKILIKFVLKLD